MGKNSHKSFFMPLFCGSSRKDVVKLTDLPNPSPKISWTGKIKKKSTTTTTHDNKNNKNNHDDNNNNNKNSKTNNNNDSNRFISSSTHEKSFGLSKRHNLFSLKNLVTTPIEPTHINKPLGHSNRYTKHHNLVPGKNIVSPAIETTKSINNPNSSKFVMKRSKSHNERRLISVRSKKYYKTSSDDHDIVISRVDEVTRELDPLPVIKCPRRDQLVNVNLCKRRGIAMKTLQIQPK